MAATKTDLAMPSGARSISIDRTIDAPLTNLAGAIGSLMETLRPTLGAMQPDDVSIELDTHCDKDRNTARFKIRAYRRDPHA